MDERNNIKSNQINHAVTTSSGQNDDSKQKIRPKSISTVIVDSNELLDSSHTKIVTSAPKKIINITSQERMQDVGNGRAQGRVSLPTPPPGPITRPRSIKHMKRKSSKLKEGVTSSEHVDNVTEPTSKGLLRTKTSKKKFRTPSPSPPRNMISSGKFRIMLGIVGLCLCLFLGKHFMMATSSVAVEKKQQSTVLNFKRWIDERLELKITHGDMNTTDTPLPLTSVFGEAHGLFQAFSVLLAISPYSLTSSLLPLLFTFPTVMNETSTPFTFPFQFLFSDDIKFTKHHPTLPVCNFDLSDHLVHDADISAMSLLTSCGAISSNNSLHSPYSISWLQLNNGALEIYKVCGVVCLTLLVFLSFSPSLTPSYFFFMVSTS
jgi:hypothetical protein